MPKATDDSLSMMEWGPYPARKRIYITVKLIIHVVHVLGEDKINVLGTINSYNIS